MQKLFVGPRVILTNPATFSERDIGFEPTTSSLGSENPKQVPADTSDLCLESSPVDDHASRQIARLCTVPMLSWHERALAADMALTAYMRSMADSIAAVLVTTGLRG